MKVKIYTILLIKTIDELMLPVQFPYVVVVAELVDVNMEINVDVELNYFDDANDESMFVVAVVDTCLICLVVLIEKMS